MMIKRGNFFNGNAEYDYDPISIENKIEQCLYGLNQKDGLIFDIANAFAVIGKKEIADVMQILLPSLTAVMQKNFNVRWYEDWGSHPISIYTLTFSESGNGKTRLVNLITKEIKSHDHIQGKKYIKAVANDSNMKKPIILHEPDSTYQALTQNVRHGSQSQAIITGEAGRFFGSFSFSSENIAGTSTGYADAWSGQFCEKSKAGDGKLSGISQKGEISLGLMGQFEIIMPKINNQILNANGFIPRFLIWQSQDTFKKIEQCKYNDKKNLSIIQQYDAIIKKLLQLEFDEQLTVKTDKDAYEMFIEKYNDIGERADKNGDLYQSRPFANRYVENMARISAVIAILENAFERTIDKNSQIIISQKHFVTSNNLMKSYLQEFQRLKMEGTNIDEAKIALTWYERMRTWETKARTKREEKGEINILLGRDISQRIKNTKEKNLTLRILIEHGYLIEKSSNRGKVFEINMTVSERDRLT